MPDTSTAASDHSRLANPPAPLTARQTVLMVVIAAIVAITRIWGRSRTLWDWDEALFCMAVDEYDVAKHRPHPPGFPVYVALARIADTFIGDNFHSLQLVTTLAAMLLFPAMFFLAREARFSFGESLSAAVLTAFLPAVWIYGGTAFSDIPALVAITVGAALLLRGCRHAPSYLLGAFVCALAIGIRSQNVLHALLPVLIASYFLRRRPAIIAVGALIAALTISVAYGAAAWSTGPDEYRTALENHKSYVANVDSYRNPSRPPLRDLASHYFVHPMRAGRTDYFLGGIALLALAIGVVRRHVPTLIAAGTFIPYSIFAWLMLDPLGIGRLSTGYVPMYALLAARGVWLIAGHSNRYRVIAATLFTLALMLPMAHRGVRSLAVLRATDSPPVAAAKWVRANLRPDEATILVLRGLQPHMEYLLPEYTRLVTDDVSTAITSRKPGYVLAPEKVDSHGAITFRRKRGPLWRIVRQFYFDVTILPAGQLVEYGEGWHHPEQLGDHAWRWMGRRGEINLSPSSSSRDVTLRFFVPLYDLPSPPVIRIEFNGREIDRFTPTEAEVVRTVTIEGGAAGDHRLAIETSDVVNLKQRGRGDDARDLGLRLWSIAISPAE